MAEFEHILVEKGEVTTLWLSRPEVRNAFHEEMISEIISALEEVATDPQCRILALRGKGRAFCAGADLNWMKKAVDYSYEQNLAESLNLSKCLHLIYTFHRPTIAIVHGAAFGGANGLLAACDFVLAESSTTFSLSEVKLGLIPACISPYVIKRIGEFHARDLILTGRPFDEKEAFRVGLVNDCGDEAQVKKRMEELISQLLKAGPHAQTKCKKLIDYVVNKWTLDEAYSETAKLIAEIRGTDEAQEGMRAFFEKRPPKWIRDE